MGNSPRLSVRLDQDAIDHFKALCDQHGLTQSEGIRIALERFGKSKPTNPERERAKYPMGRPKEAD